jgi:hypothetical protein
MMTLFFIWLALVFGFFAGRASARIVDLELEEARRNGKDAG